MAVLIDQAEFGRAVRNLVTNAIRHTPRGGTIELVGMIKSGLACVSVSDECGGIPSADLPRVFDVAFRGESARTPDPEGGAGLGLSIARGIVEAHSGKISVHNTGPGCQFLISLPLARPAPSAVTRPAATGPVRATGPIPAGMALSGATGTRSGGRHSSVSTKTGANRR
jgi:signal transduction histidine kinase